jgi:thiol-disulfide isomerase/thioredoxin
MTLRTRLIYVLVASIAAVGLPWLLYEMRARDVHVSASPPAVLDKLKLTEGTPATPAVTFYDADGKAVSLNDFRGRYVLVNLWATWCGPCINELPSLVRLQGQLPQDKITVLPLDLEKHDAQKVVEFLERTKIEGLPIYIDRDFSAMRGFAANELPLTILIDAEGKEVARAAGEQKWDHADSVAYLKAVLSHPAPGS